MKHSLLTATLATVLLFPSLVSSQEADDSSSVRDPEILLYGGLADPYLPKDFSDMWEGGWNAGAGIGHSFAPGDLGYGTLFLSGELARFVLNRTAFQTSSNLPSSAVVLRNSSHIWSVMLNFRGTFSSTRKTIAPFFVFGVGYLRAEIGDAVAIRYVDPAQLDTVAMVSGRTNSGFAWTAGIGVEAPITESIGVFVQAKSVLGVTDPTRQYFPLSGGVRYRFY